jgi:hypothetical protein
LLNDELLSVPAVEEIRTKHTNTAIEMGTIELFKFGAGTAIPSITKRTEKCTGNSTDDTDRWSQEPISHDTTGAEQGPEKEENSHDLGLPNPSMFRPTGQISRGINGFRGGQYEGVHLLDTLACNILVEVEIATQQHI